jgi:hypothetical protein
VAPCPDNCNFSQSKGVLHRTAEGFGRYLTWEPHMGGLIYLIGLIVVILAILSFFGLR